MRFGLLSDKPQPMQRWVNPMILTVGVGVAYFLADSLSSLLRTTLGVAVFWPAAGVSSGALIALGRTARWPVVAGVIAAHISDNLIIDRNVLSSSMATLSDAGEPLLVAWIIERYGGSDFNLGRLRHVLAFLAAAIVGTAVSGIGGTLGNGLVHHFADSPWTVWRHWLAANTIGIIAVAPLIIGLLEGLRAPPSRRELVEGGAALVAVAATAGLIGFLLPVDWREKTVPVVLLFPVVLWVAARCRPVFAAAAVFIVSVIVIATVTFGVGNYGDGRPSIDKDIISAQITIVGTALSALILSSLFAERREHEKHQRILTAELDHRVKNILAQVDAVTASTSRGSRSIEDFVGLLRGRIRSMAAAHSLLSESRWQGVRLDALVRTELAPYTTSANMKIGGPDVLLNPAEAQALAKVLHELTTNAAKYGALSIPNGQVSVSWDCEPNGQAATLVLEWREQGGPSVAFKVQSSYGTGLIRNLIPHELGGTVDLAFAKEGVNCRIEFPLKQA